MTTSSHHNSTPHTNRKLFTHPFTAYPIRVVSTYASIWVRREDRPTRHFPTAGGRGYHGSYIGFSGFPMSVGFSVDMWSMSPSPAHDRMIKFIYFHQCIYICMVSIFVYGWFSLLFQWVSVFLIKIIFQHSKYSDQSRFN